MTFSKCIYKTTLQLYFPSKYCHRIYWYDAIITINRFKQLKRALEWKLSDFLKFSKLIAFCLTHSLTHSLTMTSDLPSKLLGLWPPFFLSTKFMSVRTNLSYFRVVYFRLRKSAFCCEFCMITTIELGC